MAVIEALAAVFLVALMLLPLVNVAVGLIAGFMLYGIVGAAGGILAGILISALWFDQFERDQRRRDQVERTIERNWR